MFAQLACSSSLKTELTEAMLEMISFLLCLKLNKSSNVITSLQAKVERFWRNLNYKGQIVTYTLFSAGLSFILRAQVVLESKLTKYSPKQKV